MATDATIECLELQVDCYRRLAKLAEIQHAHVEQNRTDALLDVLRSRRETLDEINRLELTVGAAKQRWGEFLESMDLAARARAEELLDEARRLLEQINTADRNDVLVLQQRKLNLGRQIVQAQAARSVNRTYGTSAYGGGNGAVSGIRKMDIQR